MRCVVLASVAAAACAATSLSQISAAADLPLKAPALAVYSWTGFYFGGHIGGGWERHTVTNVGTINGTGFPAGFTSSGDISGLIGGVQGGYDWQFNNRWLAGIAADISWSGIKGDETETSTINGAVSRKHNEFKWLSTLTGRLGFLPTDPWLVYGKAGVAWGKSESNATANSAVGALTAVTSSSVTRTGWTAGVGTEYRITRNVSAVLEYDYVDFRGTIATQVSFGTSGTLLTGTTALRDHTSQIHLLKAGVNFRF